MKKLLFSTLILSFLLITSCGDTTKKKSTADDSEAGSDTEDVQDEEKSDDSDDETTTVDEDTVNSICGNEIIEAGEVCDGNIELCTDIDATLYESGKARCNDDCKGFDVLTCVELPQECGNNIVETIEVCDGDVKQCSEIDSKYVDGDANCNSTCDGWDTTNCLESTAECGDGKVEGNEKCDDSIDNCIDIDPAKYSGGKAYCLDDCTGWETETCTIKEISVDWNSGKTITADFPPRASHCALYFKDKMWILGGQATIDGTKYTNSDIWSSTDGETWKVENSDATFGERERMSCVVFKDKIWLIGGSDAGTSKNDVWTSVDGVTWEPFTDIPEGFSVGDDSTAVVFDNKLWVVGTDATNPFVPSNTYYKTDGMKWEKVDSPPYNDGRSSVEGAVMDGVLYFVAGYMSSTSSAFNDVFTSSNGLDWESYQGNFEARAFHQIFNLGGSLYILGGNTMTQRLNDVWTTSTGILWEQVTPSAGYNAVSSHAVVVSDSKICVTGGITVSDMYVSDVWCTDF